MNNFYQLQEQLDQLKAENEELKQWKETVKCLCDKTCTCKYINLENGHCSFYNKECVAINQCLYKNQQALQEIKEIAEPYYTLGSKNSPVAQILQKISEVENGR